MQTTAETFERLLETLKKVAGALRQGDVQFLLSGGLACWARGGPRTDHDVDLYLREHDVHDAAETLRAAGFRIEEPPEGWLLKAWDDDVLVDLIFRPNGAEVDEAMFERSDELEVYAVRMQVASVEDVLVTKLLALSEQDLDYTHVLEIARSLREQIDWDELERRAHTPYAKAFFTLTRELRIS